MNYSQLSGFALTTRLYSMASIVTDRERKAQMLPDVITDSKEEYHWCAKIQRRSVVDAGVHVDRGFIVSVCVFVGVEWGVAHVW